MVGRLSEEIALPVSAAELAEKFQLLLGFDPLGGDGNVEGLGKLDQQSHDGDVRQLTEHSCHESAIDLDSVNREGAEVS